MSEDADAVPGKDAVPSPVNHTVRVEFETAEHDGVVWPYVPKSREGEKK